MTGRPRLDAGLEPTEFDRWYWTVADLRAGARRLGARTSGRKADLTAAIRAVLAGELPPDAPTSRPSDTLGDDLTRSTPLTPPQPMTRALRAFMVEQCGPGFRFDAHMRNFFATEHDGSLTLGDAVDHWNRTRSTPPDGIDAQFEYNRFVRDWRAAHADASHADVVAA